LTLEDEPGPSGLDDPDDNVDDDLDDPNDHSSYIRPTVLLPATTDAGLLPKPLS
jgi:hypothetical protein